MGTDAAEKRLSKSDEDAKVGALTKHTVKAAVTATDATVKVSGYVADRVGNLTKRMASYLAAKVVDPNKPGGIKKGGSAMGTLVDAARGGLVAYGTVYNGLEANAKVREQPKGEQREGGAAQVRQPGGGRVWEGLHSGRQRCNDLHERSEPGRERAGEEDSEEHREEHRQEHCGNGVGGEEGGDTRRD